MKSLTFAVTILCAGSIAQGSPCVTQALSVYVGGGANTCTEASGSLTVGFNQNVLPSYVGLNVLGGNNGANPADISVVPGNPGLDFQSSDFSDNNPLLSAQAELVHFMLSAPTGVTETTLTLDDPITSDGGGLGLGTGLIIAQELLCVGGAFTSLPVGLVTSVANGVIGGGEFGCNGTTVIGTASASSGVLTGLSGLLGNLNPLTLNDTAVIQLTPVANEQIDVIKLQAIFAGLGGSASDQGFGNTYTLGSSTATPEPGSSMLMLAAGIVLTGNRFFLRLLKRVRR